MNVLVLLILLGFCITDVITRSVRSDKTKEVDSEIIENVIWNKLEPIPRVHSQKEEDQNSAADEKSFNQDSSGPKFSLSTNGTENSTEEVEQSVDQEKTLHINSNEIMELLEDKNTRAKPSNYSKVEEKSLSIAPVIEVSAIQADFDSINGSESDLLNVIDNEIVFQSLTDNSSTAESFIFDETALMSEGKEIVLLQEVSTIGVELMIDSETSQNLILSDLLGSQVIVIEDEESDSGLSTIPLEEDSNLVIMNVDFHLDNGNKLNETVVTHSEGTEKIKFNAMEIENGKLNTITTESISETASIQNSPKCPAPGWCIFWFLAQDSCTKNSHCFGSRICCQSGCSKMCIDVGN